MSETNQVKEQIQNFSHQLGEPSEMTEKRLEALDLIDQLDYPKIERAKYYRWLNLDDQKFDQAASGETDLLPIKESDGPYLRSYHGKTLESSLSQDLKDQGVIFASFDQVYKDKPELIQDYYMNQVVDYRKDKLSAHHTAFMNAGVVLYIPKNVQIQDPVQLNMIQDASQGASYNNHVLIVMEENSACTFVEKMTTQGDGEATANIVVEIVAKANAQIHYSNIDELGENTRAFIRRQATCDDGANVDWAIGSMSNGNIVLDAYTELRGRGSESDLKIVSITHGDQEQIINSHVLNIGSQSKGNIFQHGAILDNSRLTFNGIGKIEKGAKDADAQQESRILMFSEGGRGDANPILLIDEYEVMAGHAASIGQIDQEQLYYLMSRGIDEKTAMKLAIRGFLGPVIQAIPLDTVKKELVENIERKLESL